MKATDLSFRSGGNKIAATLYTAVAGPSSRTPLVLILTGDSPKGLRSGTWPPLVERLAANGLDVFAFDFLSQGGSGGDRTDLTLTAGRNNLADAISALTERGELSDRRLAAVASSFGASVLLSSAAAIPPLSALVLKSPALDLATAYENESGSWDNMKAWRITGKNETLGLSFRAYEDAVRANIYAGAFLLTCPTLVMHGDADELVPIGQSRRLQMISSGNVELRVIPGGQHDYKQPGAAEAFLLTSCEFLKGHLLGQ